MERNYEKVLEIIEKVENPFPLEQILNLGSIRIVFEGENVKKVGLNIEALKQMREKLNSYFDIYRIFPEGKVAHFIDKACEFALHGIQEPVFWTFGYIIFELARKKIKEQIIKEEK